MIKYINGMPFVPVTFPANEHDGLYIENIQLDYSINYINKHNIKSVYVCYLDDYSLFEKCTNIEHITLELNVLPQYYSKLEKKGKKLVKCYDIESLYQVKGLKSLSVNDKELPFITSKLAIDLDRIPSLEKYSGSYKFIKNIEYAKSIKTLRLSNFSERNLSKLNQLTDLDTFSLMFSKTDSLDGCENNKKLQCLYLNYNRSLTDISALKHFKKTLRALRIDNCPKITDFSVLKELENLELLELSGNNKLPSLNFISHLPNLKTIIFSMEIEDGDLTPCINIPYVGILKSKRTYNLKSEDFTMIPGYRGNENIPMWRRFE